MNTLSIRPVNLSDDHDISVIHQIYSHSVLHHTASWELSPPDLAEMRQRVQKVLEAGYPYFVGEMGGRVVSYTYASSYRPRPGYRFTVENSIYVAPDLHGQGLGKQMLGALIEACRAQGYRQMIAVIGDAENVASIKLHQALGFVHVGTFHNIGYKFDRWLDSVQMQKTLITPPPAQISS